jgi:hypothetical protein
MICGLDDSNVALLRTAATVELGMAQHGITSENLQLCDIPSGKLT